MFRRKIRIWDETLRDGAQMPGVFLGLRQKMELARMLDGVGVSYIAAGFPATDPEEKRVVRRLMRERLDARVVAVARALRPDIDACLDAGAGDVSLFIGVSPLHMRQVLRMTPREVVERVAESVSYVRDHGATPHFVAVDGSRSGPFLRRALQAARGAGAESLCIADTVGILTPRATRRLVRSTPAANAIHCHNDLGLATANTLAAIEAGVTLPHVCINGYGERSGNAPLEEAVMALEVLHGVRTGIRTERLTALSRAAERLFRLPLPVHKPVVGLHSFAHESGIHVHGHLQSPLSFQPYPPERAGQETTLLLGKSTGTRHVAHLLRQRRIPATEAQAREIALRVRRHHAQARRDPGRFRRAKADTEALVAGVPEAEFWRIARRVLGRP